MENAERSDTPSMGMSVLSGLVAIVLGILLIALPDVTLNTFVWLFGALVVVYGVIYAVAALMGRRGGRWSGLFLGLVAIGIGAAVMAWPDLTAKAAIIVVAVWALASGVLEIAVAFEGPPSGGRRVFWVIGGLISVALGLVIMFYPAESILTILWLVGVYLLFAGCFRIAAGVFSRTWDTGVGLGPGPR